MKRNPSTPYTRRLAITLAVLAGFTLALPAQAQGTYPNKPIRMIVPLAAGSAVDVAARLLAQKMAENMGQPIVVENLVGASGIIGADKLAKSAPDGYTIGGFNDSVLTMVPNLNKATPFNPVTDFAHISKVATIEFSIAVASNSPYKTAAELVAAAKASPGKITYASGGNGSPQHLGGALFAAHTGIDLKHVPYRGASQAALDVAGNQVDVTMQGIATVASLAKAGKLRLIGVMADNRHSEYPDTPTLKEQGIQGFDYSTWFALTSPKGTPKDIVDRLQREVVKALNDPALKERYAGLGLLRNGTTPAELTTLVRDQLARYGKAIRDNNITE
ncbi:Bug family tripartite tricarboxylate transporter substrate binding protein [Polaromonas eurypsychrophila]|uniref:MFS transporter n=1 Tax=Polaromonas eurypsychrophila TaxID=1614635 RepID=A0A916WDW8_9BURK|nr:tripartite tricarboxylate transporter substrate binding protein [Polaromonas eurypsychrophila]GGA89259.1 MFS transporter [Polaromonas eurypsychrophila]